MTSGRPSSTEFVRSVLVAAADQCVPDLAKRARESKNLRTDSGELFAALALAEFQSADNLRSIASSGLKAFDQGHRQIVKRAWATEIVSTREISGDAAVINPVRDDELHQLVQRGLAEPGCLHLPNPPRSLEHLPTLVAFGCFAELSIVRDWLAAGGTVAAIGRGDEQRWADLADFAKHSAGTLLIPTRHGNSSPGLDLVTDCDAVSAWVSQLARNRKLVLGVFFYAAGAAHLAVQSATDAVIAVATEQLGPEIVSVTYMGTPTDSTVVSAGLGVDSVRRWTERSLARKLRDSSFAIGGWLKKPAPVFFSSAAGASLALVDSSVSMQGANYLAAKRAQRWRAYLLQLAGFRVVYQVLPPANTKSVVGFEQLAVAYRGTAAVGINPMEAETARGLYAFLLAAQLVEAPADLRPKTSHCAARANRIARRFVASALSAQDSLGGSLAPR